MNTGFVRPAVATVLTACGIETTNLSRLKSYVATVATVLTACGIETGRNFTTFIFNIRFVATVLTACGIETTTYYFSTVKAIQLQQYLPLAVLKL